MPGFRMVKYIKGRMGNGKRLYKSEASRTDREAGRMEREAGRMEREAGRIEREAGRIEREAGRIEREAGLMKKEVGRMKEEVGRMKEVEGADADHTDTLVGRTPRAPSNMGTWCYHTLVTNMPMC